MTAPNPNAPIIIKRIKKVAGGHHGGAWKVAYADFVTAMMAFFLLLWLLSVTTDIQKKGIADYFTPTTGLKDSLGIGFKGGKAKTEEGTEDKDKAKPGLVVGQVTQGPTPQKPNDVTKPPEDIQTGAPVEAPPSTEDQNEQKESTNTAKSKDADEDSFKKVQEEVMNAFENTPELKELKNNIIVTHTPEGLKIDMVDDQNRPIFQAGGSTLTEVGKKVMKAVGGIVEKTDNRVAIAGHTDASVLNIGGNYSNWELSSERANSSRRYLEQNVIEPERVARVSGMASQDLLTPNEPNSPRNRRISLTLLRGTHMKGVKPMNTSKGLLSVPDVQKDAPVVAAPPDAVNLPSGPKSDEVKSQEQILQQKAPGLFGAPPAQ